MKTAEEIIKEVFGERNNLTTDIRSKIVKCMKERTSQAIDRYSEIGKKAFPQSEVTFTAIEGTIKSELQ